MKHSSTREMDLAAVPTMNDKMLSRAPPGTGIWGSHHFCLFSLNSAPVHPQDGRGLGTTQHRRRLHVEHRRRSPGHKNQTRGHIVPCGSAPSMATFSELQFPPLRARLPFQQRTDNNTSTGSTDRMLRVIIKQRNVCYLLKR